MPDHPRGPEILEAVARLLRVELMPQLQGNAAFQARVAANAIDLVAREIRHGAAADAAALKSLRLLLDQPEADLDSLESRLAAGLRRGEITLDTPGAREHLWQTTLQKMAIDQPNYASYQRALALRAAAASPEQPTE